MWLEDHLTSIFFWARYPLDRALVGWASWDVLTAQQLPNSPAQTTPQLVYNHLFHPVEQTTGNMAFRSVRKRDDDISPYHKPNYGSGYPEHPSIKKTKLDTWSLDYLLRNPESRLADIDLKVCFRLYIRWDSLSKTVKKNTSSLLPLKSHSSASNTNLHRTTTVLNFFSLSDYHMSCVVPDTTSWRQVRPFRVPSLFRKAVCAASRQSLGCYHL